MARLTFRPNLSRLALVPLRMDKNCFLLMGSGKLLMEDASSSVFAGVSDALALGFECILSSGPLFWGGGPSRIFFMVKIN